MITFKVDSLKEMNARLSQFADYLEDSGVDADAVFDSRLVSCELITNVIRHCGGTACFSAILGGGEITITVHAENPVGNIAIPELPAVLAESGRGLYIVNALSGGKVSIAGSRVTVVITAGR